MMAKIQTPKNIEDTPIAIVKNMITLATSGFGLVVALAWNEFIKTAVSKFLDPLLGKNGGAISLLIYAIVMTGLAVIVTMQLSHLQKKMEAAYDITKAKIKNGKKKTR